MEAKKPDNVIQLPTRVRESGEQGPVAPVRPSVPIWVPVALAGTLVLSYVGNRFTLTGESTDLASSSSASRGLASVEDRLDWNRDSQWEQEVAEKLAKAPSRELASIRAESSVTLEDELRFGDLGSHYAVRFDSGQLVEIRLPQTAQTENLVYFRNKEFFEKYRELLPAGAHFPNRVTRQVTDKGINEVYALVDRSNSLVGETSVQLDPYGRLLSMKVQAAR